MTATDTEIHRRAAAVAGHAGVKPEPVVADQDSFRVAAARCAAAPTWLSRQTPDHDDVALQLSRRDLAKLLGVAPERLTNQSALERICGALEAMEARLSRAGLNSPARSACLARFRQGRGGVAPAGCSPAEIHKRAVAVAAFARVKLGDTGKAGNQ